MKEKQQIRLRSKLLMAVSMTVCSAGLLYLFAENWSRPVYDLLFRLRGSLPTSNQVVIVAVDDLSLDELNQQWPWPRSYHAKLLDSVFAAGAKAVALDILFGEPAADDAEFAAAVARHPQVVLAKDVSVFSDPVSNYKQIKTVAPDSITALLPNPANTGYVTMDAEGDGFLRRTKLQITDVDSAIYGESFALKAAEIYAGSAAPFAQFLQDNSPKWINFAGPVRTVPTVSYYQALKPDTFLPPGFFKDKLVFVGASLQAEANIFTPTADHFLSPFSREDNAYIPGVEVHANIALNLLGQRFINYLDFGSATVIGLLLGFGSAVLFLTFRPLLSSLLFALTALLICLFTFHEFTARQFVMAPVYLLLPLTVSYLACPFIHYWHTFKQKNFIRKAFSTYLAPALVTQLINNPERLELGGEELEGTVIFLDLSGFTTFSEKLPPRELIDLINRNLGACAEVVLKWQGMIDKYIGDCIMAVWGVPISTADHAVNACYAVCDIQERMKSLAFEEQKLTGVSLSVRIGVNSGQLVAGNVGGGQQFNYTVLGNEVNLASRLEGTNKYYGTDVIVSEGTAKLVSDHFALREIDVIRVVGQKVPVKIYQLLGKRDAGKAYQEVDTIFQEGRSLYRVRKWEEAKKRFQDALKVSPEDGPSKTFILRCDRYAGTPPGPDWDGVYQMMTK